MELVKQIRHLLREAEAKDTMTSLKDRKDVRDAEKLGGYLYWKHYDKPPNPTGKGGFTKTANSEKPEPAPEPEPIRFPEKAWTGSPRQVEWAKQIKGNTMGNWLAAQGEVKDYLDWVESVAPDEDTRKRARVLRRTMLRVAAVLQANNNARDWIDTRQAASISKPPTANPLGRDRFNPDTPPDAPTDREWEGSRRFGGPGVARFSRMSAGGQDVLKAVASFLDAPGGSRPQHSDGFNRFLLQAGVKEAPTSDVPEDELRRIVSKQRAGKDLTRAERYALARGEIQTGHAQEEIAAAAGTTAEFERRRAADSRAAVAALGGPDTKYYVHQSGARLYLNASDEWRRGRPPKSFGYVVMLGNGEVQFVGPSREHQAVAQLLKQAGLRLRS